MMKRYRLSIDSSLVVGTFVVLKKLGNREIFLVSYMTVDYVGQTYVRLSVYIYLVVLISNSFSSLINKLINIFIFRLLLVGVFLTLLYIEIYKYTDYILVEILNRKSIQSPTLPFNRRNSINCDNQLRKQ